MKSYGFANFVDYITTLCLMNTLVIIGENFIDNHDYKLCYITNYMELINNGPQASYKQDVSHD